MKNFDVTVLQKDFYFYEVEAENWEDAQEKCMEIHGKAYEEGTLEATDGDTLFHGLCDGINYGDYF